MELPDFKTCVEMLRSSNSVTYEEGYLAIQAYLGKHLDEIVVSLRNESDVNMRGRFVELIGDSKNPKMISLLREELAYPNQEVRMWAYNALENMEHPEADAILKEFVRLHPTESFL